ncbi:hypothetical protein QTP86_030636 [Hemibagrus guttatus]|nr:hypothetical protein QTP86_030636 [Hemibagrus guttatus]
MAKTKELSKDTRNKIVDLHQAGKTESAIASLQISTPYRKSLEGVENPCCPATPPKSITALEEICMEEWAKLPENSV